MTPEPDAPTDEQLSAYLDGELDDLEADRIERRAAADPTLQARIDRLAAVDRRLRSVFPVAADEPAVSRIAAKITAAPTNVVPISDRRLGQRSTSANRFVPALMAASLALLIGFGGGFLYRGLQTTTTPSIAIGPVAPDAVLATLLETSPTGEPVTAGGTTEAGSLVVAATFKDRNGRPCREFESVRGPVPSGTVTAVGVACRDEGRWVVRGLVSLAGDGSTPSNVTPSSNETKDALDALLTALGASQALTPADEAETIKRGWR